MRNNHTNNYAESIFKLVKENLLERVRLYNPVALFEFTVNELCGHYQNKLKSEINNTYKLNREFTLIPKLIETNLDIAKFEDNSIYNLKIGVCTCPLGKNGAPCDHSLYLSSQNYDVPNEQGRHLQEVKKRLFWVSTGEELADVSFFKSIHDKEMPKSRSI